MSDLSQQLNKIASDKATYGKQNVLLAIAALVLLDKNNDVAFDADDLPGTLSRLNAAGSTNGVVDLEGAGDPANSPGTRANIGTGSGVANTALLYTLIPIGSLGNGFSIEYVDPNDTDIPLSFELDGQVLTITLATDSGGVITTTAGDIVTLLAGSDLVTVTNNSGSNGTGLIAALAAKSVADFGNPGVDDASSGVGVAGTGSRYTDITAGNLWINTGSKAAPVWVKLATV